MQRPSSLPPGWQPPSGALSRRRSSPEPSQNRRREVMLRDDRYARWHVPITEERETEAWQLSYLDLISLLLVVFAVLWVITKTELNSVLAQAAVIAEAEAESAIVASQNETMRENAALPVTLVSPLRGEPWNPISELDMQAYASPTLPTEPALPTPAQLGLDELGDGISVIVGENSISFRISSESLFASGQAELLPSGAEVLERLLKVFAERDNRISIEGHSDAMPIHSDRFPSNWELSAGRAASVLRHLENHGIHSGRLRATGYADTRPISSNNTAAGRAANRRVELIMETP